KNYIYLLLGALIIVSFYSCKGAKDFLSPPNKSKLNGNSQWASEGNADIFMNDVYGSLKILYNSPESLDNFTDFNDAGYYYSSWAWKNGTVTKKTTDGGAFDGLDTGPRNIIVWHSIYSKIRKANTFIKEVKEHSKNFSESWMHKRIDES